MAQACNQLEPSYWMLRRAAKKMLFGSHHNASAISIPIPEHVKAVLGVCAAQAVQITVVNSSTWCVDSAELGSISCCSCPIHAAQACCSRDERPLVKEQQRTTSAPTCPIARLQAYSRHACARNVWFCSYSPSHLMLPSGSYTRRVLLLLQGCNSTCKMGQQRNVLQRSWLWKGMCCCAYVSSCCTGCHCCRKPC